MALDGRLAGRIAIVSGANRGVGRTYALALAGAGAKVMALARSADGDPTIPGTLAELVTTGRAAGLTIAARLCDIGDEADIRHAVEQTVDRRRDTVGHFRIDRSGSRD
jgi:citronellol/citronellal dehydrogenase